MRLTRTQIEAMESLRDGHMHGFGYGFGRYRVALRALYHRQPSLLKYEAKDGDEFFGITSDGLSVLNDATI